MSLARLFRLVLALAGALALLVASTGLAGAEGPPEGKADKAQAQQAPPADAGANSQAAKPEPKPQPAKPQSTAPTEDTDTNDGDTPNNVVDDGDNAHPSGKDRSVEPGGSGNQGNAAHDPDDDGNGPDRSNGGLDQPDGPGGVDLADQDGNNGCGNDDDFEDDNEGLCRGRQGQEPDDDDDDDTDEDVDDDDEEVDDDEDEVVDDEDEVDDVDEGDTDEDVLGEGDDDGEELPAVLGAAANRTPEAAVLGVSQTRSPGAVGALARTGTDAAGTLIPLGVSLLLLGAALEIKARRRMAGIH